MFKKVRDIVKRTTTKVRNGVLGLCVKVEQAKSGEMYVDTAAKILIACVLGMLLLVSLYALFKNVIIPNVTTKTTDMFNYAA